MAKKVIKEIIIMLLLCLAIILVLGVLLYEYVPSNKMIPEKVSYTTPENIKEELSKSDGVDDEQVILTYSIDATDLNNYERINTYVPGKPNPFSSYDTSSNAGENTNQNGSSTGNGNASNSSAGSNSTNSTNSSNSSSSSNNSNNITGSGSKYFPDTGTK